MWSTLNKCASVRALLQQVSSTFQTVVYSLLYQITYFSKNIDDYDVKENNDNDDDCFYVRTAVPYLTT